MSWSPPPLVQSGAVRSAIAVHVASRRWLSLGLGHLITMKYIVVPIIVACLMIGCASRSAGPSHISVQEFESQYKLGHMQTMKDAEYLGQLDGRAYLRIRSMSLTDSKQWSEQIVFVKLSDLDKQFRDALPPKEYRKP